MACSWTGDPTTASRRRGGRFRRSHNPGILSSWVQFFRNFMHAYVLHPQDLAPNSILNICYFQVFCEVYLQRKLTLTLFAEFFYGNKQTEYNGGPLLECGGIAIQRRTRSMYPSLMLSTYVKTWQKSFFYCTA